MKMKTIRSKGFIKNDRIFIEIFAVKKDGLLPIHQLRKEVGLPRLKKIKRWIDAFVGRDDNEAWQLVIQRVLEVNKETDHFLGTLEVSKKKKLIEGINQIRIDNNLGQQWFPNLIYFIVVGFFIPPFNDFYLEINKKDKELNIKLNPNTTIADIEESWPMIKKAQEKILCKAERKNLTKKWAEKIALYAKHQTLKQKMLKDELLDYKPTDSDVVGQVFTDEKDISAKADAKRVNRIRQMKSRLERGTK